ncbi:tyrosine-type recombinase/integrase [Peribacillus muralis]|uniref:tyrosine-type recombinase/integrase n=1 Tax=Peribacillus muralis TaxID=264697 RepID=UPI003D08A089
MITDLIDDFLTVLNKEGLKASSVKRYSADLQQFLIWLENNAMQTDIESLQCLSAADLNKYRDYLSSHDYSDDTVRRLYVVLNRFFVHLGLNIPLDQLQASSQVKRDLTAGDFVTKQELNKLLTSMQSSSYMAPGAALETRIKLMDRNMSIVVLISTYGLSPAEIYSIDMNDINFAQSVITVDNRRIQILNEHIAVILRYFNSIPEALRPRYRTSDPLFVAFYNIQSTYRFDYQSGKPSRLSIRSIQHMIQSEIYLAGLRKITAINLRNTCILEALKSGKQDDDIVHFFGFKSSFSLHRYKRYLSSIK